MIVLTMFWIVLRTVLIILFAVLLAVLAVPFTYRVHLVRTAERSGFAQVEGGWLFGLVRVQGFFREERGAGARVVLAGIPIDATGVADRARGKWPRRKKTEPAETKEESEKEKSARKHRLTRTAFSLVRAAIRRGLAHLKPRRLTGWGRIGFSDPSHTGYLCAVLESTRGLGVHALAMEYVFDRECYEGEFDAAGRVCIGYLVWQALCLLVHKPSRELLLGA